jgi:hypothetical protein
VLGSGAQPGHGTVDNRERSAAVWAAALRPASAIRPAPRPAASAKRPAMGLWSAEALLVGPTRSPLQVVVNGRARASCGDLRTCDGVFDHLVYKWNGGEGGRTRHANARLMGIGYSRCGGKASERRPRGRARLHPAHQAHREFRSARTVAAASGPRERRDGFASCICAIRGRTITREPVYPRTRTPRASNRRWVSLCTKPEAAHFNSREDL